MAEGETTETPLRTFIYIGRRIVKGKLLNVFKKDLTTGLSTYWPDVKVGAFTGCVIGESYSIGTRMPLNWREAKVGSVDPQLALEWQAFDRAEYLAHKQKSVDSSPELTKALASIARARQLMSSNQRLAFDVWVLQEIRK